MIRRRSSDGEGRPEAGGRDRVWAALVLDLAPDRVDEALARLTADSIGVDLDVSDSTTRLRIWFEQNSQARAALSAARFWLAASDDRMGRTAGRVEQIEDGHWVERYQAGLVPFPLGSRFTVDPRGEEVDEPADTGRSYIHLDPGRAFGTGEHTTTRLCVGLLESLVRPGSRWLDLGCGSGILSVVARQLGASRVAAVDLDADAVAVAQQVFARNGLSRHIMLWNGSLPGLVSNCWDGVVANVELPYFLDNAAQLGRLPVMGGLLIASGFLGRDARLVALRLGRVGLDPLRIEIDPPWAALAARRVEP
jgi:ribosomal protein L11 methyltransferase